MGSKTDQTNGMAKWAERLSPVFDRSWDSTFPGSNPGQILVKSNQCIKNWMLFQPSMAFSIINLGQGTIEWEIQIVNEWNFPP